MEWLDRAFSFGAQQEALWLFTFWRDLISSIDILSNELGLDYLLGSWFLPVGMMIQPTR
jgi:hypothetical protein